MPSANWEHFALYRSVRDAIAALPVYFRTETHISGVIATDLHTLNSLLGATIEEQVVRTLNLIRNAWDPQGHYALYHFVRQPQTFPDVRLRKSSGEETLLGIELKGWYLLAKEGEPSLRFQASPDACAPQDLIVVVPWVLGNVISGAPILFEPFIESAKYAAEFRNHHWQNVRKAKGESAVDLAVNVRPYPLKNDAILDRPREDAGGNFGRIARTGLMDEYIARLDAFPLCGVKMGFWREFLRAFQESSNDEEARAALDRLRQRVRRGMSHSAPKVQAALAIVAELEKLLELPSD